MEEHRARARSHRSGKKPRTAQTERDGDEAQTAASEHFENAARVGQRLVERVRGAHPAILGIAVVGGAALAVTLWRATRRPKPRFLLEALQPREEAAPSMWWELGRAAAVSLATSAGRHLAERLVHPIESDQQVSAGHDSPHAGRPEDS